MAKATASTRGYELGELFRVIGVNGGSTTTKGSIVEFVCDDGSSCPEFKLLSGEMTYSRLSNGNTYVAWEFLEPVVPNDTETTLLKAERQVAELQVRLTEAEVLVASIKKLLTGD